MIHLSLLHLLARLHASLTSFASFASRRRDEGQTTAEYALVLLGAAAVAVLLLAWATRTNRIGKLFDFVLDQVVGRVT